jgi:hypothetical protein
MHQATLQTLQTPGHLAALHVAPCCHSLDCTTVMRSMHSCVHSTQNLYLTQEVLRTPRAAEDVLHASTVPLPAAWRAAQAFLLAQLRDIADMRYNSGMHTKPHRQRAQLAAPRGAPYTQNDTPGSCLDGHLSASPDRAAQQTSSKGTAHQHMAAFRQMTCCCQGKPLQELCSQLWQ